MTGQKSSLISPPHAAFTGDVSRTLAHFKRLAIERMDDGADAMPLRTGTGLAYTGDSRGCQVMLVAIGSGQRDQGRSSLCTRLSASSALSAAWVAVVAAFDALAAALPV